MGKFQLNFDSLVFKFVPNGIAAEIVYLQKEKVCSIISDETIYSMAIC